MPFLFQMQLASESMYPGFARHIYLKGVPLQSASASKISSDRGRGADEYGGRDEKCHGSTGGCTVWCQVIGVKIVVESTKDVCAKIAKHEYSEC